MKRSGRACRGAAAVAVCLSCAVCSAQSPRNVVVNGERLEEAAIARLERAACTRIPDGNYWLAERSGLWGYTGNPAPQGRLGNCTARRPAHSRPYSTASEPVPAIRRDAHAPASPGDIRREEAEIGTSTLPRAPQDGEQGGGAP